MAAAAPPCETLCRDGRPPRARPPRAGPAGRDGPSGSDIPAKDFCKTPEHFAAWSMNLGHENTATTLSACCPVSPAWQAELIGACITPLVKRNWQHAMLAEFLTARYASLADAKATGGDVPAIRRADVTMQRIL